MAGGAVGEQHQLVPPLAERQEQRQQDVRISSQWLIGTSIATAPPTARSTKPIAIVSTSMITTCFSGPE